jgi:hypothetical protein
MRFIRHHALRCMQRAEAVPDDSAPGHTASSDLVAVVTANEAATVTATARDATHSESAPLPDQSSSEAVVHDTATALLQQQLPPQQQQQQQQQQELSVDDSATNSSDVESERDENTTDTPDDVADDVADDVSAEVSTTATPAHTEVRHSYYHVHRVKAHSTQHTLP